MSALVWLTLSVTLGAVALHWVRPLLFGDLAAEGRMFTLAFLATPAVFEVLGAGQDSVLLLVLWIAALRLMVDGRRRPRVPSSRSGCSNHSSCAWSRYLFVVRKQWKALAGFSAVGLLLAMVANLRASAARGRLVVRSRRVPEGQADARSQPGPRGGSACSRCRGAEPPGVPGIS